ncbi:hypothetical protein V7S76_08410 [Aquirufa sp. ROCK2-A2]
MEQSFKANELLKHFQDHKKQTPNNFNFFDFLWLHYSADSKHPKTTQHPNLPSLDLSGAAGYIIPSFYLIFILPALVFFSRRYQHTWKNFYHFSVISIIIAPPRANTKLCFVTC